LSGVKIKERASAFLHSRGGIRKAQLYSSLPASGGQGENNEPGSREIRVSGFTCDRIPPSPPSLAEASYGGHCPPMLAKA